MSRGAGYDRHITIFSPDGKLYQVEYAFKAIANCLYTSVGIRGSDCVVVATQRKTPDRLQAPSQHLFSISASVGGVSTGLEHDSMVAAANSGYQLLIKVSIEKAQGQSAQYRHEYGYTAPAAEVARGVADDAQAAMRPLATTLILAGWDAETGPALHKCDPAGYTAGHLATSAGAKQNEALVYLEKRLKGKPPMAFNDCVEIVLNCLANVLQVDLKPTDVEVGYVSKTAPFTKMEEVDVETHLSRIAEMAD